MTDLKKFVDLYKSFGITLQPEKTDDGWYIEIREGANEKLEGYNMFYSSVEFSKSGKFLKQGFYE